MSDKKFDCITCGYNNEDDNYLVPNVGMVCDSCMTTDHHALWNCNNFAHNPDSYDGAPCPPEINCGHFVPCSECQGAIAVGEDPCYCCSYAGGKTAGDEQ
tara:strand:+ start:62 stop:361 length:300 start_codon:yes stop_codon:yes gene_type:complete